MQPFLFMLLSMFICALAYADIITLNPLESVTDAARNAQAGDTILLEPGDYWESVKITERSVVIASMFLLDGDASHITSTIVNPLSEDPDSASCIFLELEYPDSLTMVGLTIRNGRGTRHTIGEVSYIAGGGIYASRSRFRFEHCAVESCRADVGGGLMVSHYDSDPSILYGAIVECVFKNCVNFGAAGGGGIASHGSTLLMERTLFEACTSNFTAGIEAAGRNMSLVACTLRYCGSAWGAAGIIGDGGLVSNCVFEDNGSSVSDDYLADCHLSTQGDVIVRQNVFRNNTSNGTVGTFFDFSRYGVLFFVGNVVENHITGNSLGIFYLWDCEGEISHNIIRNCYADYGASFVPGGSGILRFHHNAFVNNSQGPQGFGTAIDYSNSGSTPASCDSNVFEGNVGPVMSYAPNRPPQYIIARNNWWGDASGPYHPTRNPDGQGDTLYSDVIQFEPWLTEPPDTSQPTSVVDRPDIASLSTWKLLPAYPNPFNSTFRVDIAGFTRGDFELVLYDVLGRKVSSLHTGVLQQNVLMFTAPQAMSNGVFFLRARDKHRVEAQKILYIK